MVAQKRGPTLPTVARQALGSVLGDGSWRYLVAKLSKLGGDFVLTPERVFGPTKARTTRSRARILGLATERCSTTICWRRTTFSARSAARERKAERSARVVLGISLMIPTQTLSRRDHSMNPEEISCWFDLAPSFCGAQAKIADDATALLEVSTS
jgi:hypothetical protein